MFTKSQEKLVKSLQTKKGREKSGLCLVEGKKVIEMAGDLIEFTFTEKESPIFSKLVTTVAPQMEAAVARIPEWTQADILAKDVTLLLDGVQDPGNVGTILRLCLGFDASLLLVESADVANPKVIRASTGALFQVPWKKIERDHAANFVAGLHREVYRLENRPESTPLRGASMQKPLLLIAGSEGGGIHLDIRGQAIHVEHRPELESLNVANAIAIALYRLQESA